MRSRQTLSYLAGDKPFVYGCDEVSIAPCSLPASPATSPVAATWQRYVARTIRQVRLSGELPLFVQQASARDQYRLSRYRSPRR